MPARDRPAPPTVYSRYFYMSAIVYENWLNRCGLPSFDVRNVQICTMAEKIEWKCITFQVHNLSVFRSGKMT